MMEVNKPSINIAFTHDVFFLGGAERITIDIAKYLKQFKGQYKLFVYTPRIIEDRITDKIRDLLTISNIRPKGQEKASDIERLVREHKIDILVQVATRIPEAGKIKERTGIKLVYANHGEPFWQRYTLMARFKRNTYRKVTWAIYGKAIWEWLGKARRSAIRKSRRYYDEADVYTVLCDAYKFETCKAFNINPKESKIKVLYNSERVVEDVNLEKENLIIFSGRLTRSDKRVDRLIRIWSHIEDKLPNWELKIVGDGPERENLEKLANSNHLKRLSFEGMVDDTRKYYKKASIVCLVSQTEGWPLSLTEAQAHGCIPIAFGCSSGVKDILSPNGINGFIVTAFDEKEYAKTLLEICSMSKEKQMKIRLSAIEKRKAYNPDITNQEWKKLFDELMLSKNI